MSAMAPTPIVAVLIPAGVAIILAMFIFNAGSQGWQLAQINAKLNAILRNLGVSYPPPLSAHVQDIALSEGGKIAAIKAYRTETGTDLKTAKDAVEAWLAQRESS